MLVDSGVIEPRSKLGGPGAADGREAEFDKERQDNGHGPL